MSLQHLQYVTAIAHTGSLSGAAEYLHVSQPTLSRYLRDLEQRLSEDLFPGGAQAKISLFQSGRRRLTPTQAGRIYVQAAGEILAIMQQTKSSIAAKFSGPSSVIRFGASPFAGSHMVAAAFTSFFSSFPQIRIEIVEGGSRECVQKLQKEEIDLCIISGISPEALPSEYPSLKIIPFETSALMAKLPIYHPSAQKYLAAPDNNAVISLQELTSTPLILPAKTSVSRRVLERLFQDQQFSPAIAYETSNINLLRQLPEDGFGVSLLPAHNATDRVTEKTVTLPLSPSVGITNAIAFLGTKTLNEAERLLLTQVLLKRHPDQDIEPLMNEFKKSAEQDYMYRE